MKFRLYGEATAANPCVHCGGKTLIWFEQPYPGHNLRTLYECKNCRSVLSLAEAWGYLNYLPGRATPGGDERAMTTRGDVT